MQYIGKTFIEFRLQRHNCKGNKRNYLRKEARMEQHLFQRFSSEGHSGFLDEASIIFIDKTNTKNSNKREQYW